jgi:hypothetical protein
MGLFAKKSLPGGAAGADGPPSLSASSFNLGARAELPIGEFVTNTTTAIVGALKEQVKRSKDPRFAHTMAFDDRYRLLERMLPTPERGEVAPGRSILERVVRGYVTEFLRQTAEDIHPCNVVSDKVDRSAVQRYWESQPREDFWAAISSGVYHSAFSYKTFREERAHATSEDDIGRKAAWGALIEVVKHSVAQFKAHCVETFPGVEPRASLYNNHQLIMRYAVMLEHHRLRLIV